LPAPSHCALDVLFMGLLLIVQTERTFSAHPSCPWGACAAD
jgi:hypothetical protein